MQPQVPTVNDINDYIQNLLAYAFKKKPDQHKNTFSNKLNTVLQQIEAGAYQGAIKKLLNDVRAKADGYIDGKPKNDWITDETAQINLCGMIDALIAHLKTLQ